MARIAFFSDLHNEFTNYSWQIPHTDADLICLLGDIGVGLNAIRWTMLQSEMLEKPIVYILGNHEYYHHDLSIIDRMREEAQDSSVVILNNESVEFEGIDIIGSSLWTGYSLYGPQNQKVAMDCARDCMADHKLIRNINGSIFMPEDALALHKESLDWIKTKLYSSSSNKKLVLTHHAPSAWAIGSKYRGDMLSPAFANDFDELILETKPIAWWSGHTHGNYSRKVGDTLLMSNQRGYPAEGITGFDPHLVMEI